LAGVSPNPANVSGQSTNEARAAGMAWLHVDFEGHLRDFYLGACGFTSTDAGLIAL
jgi:hypothetical protein